MCDCHAKLWGKLTSHVARVGKHRKQDRTAEAALCKRNQPHVVTFTSGSLAGCAQYSGGAGKYTASGTSNSNPATTSFIPATSVFKSNGTQLTPPRVPANSRSCSSRVVCSTSVPSTLRPAKWGDLYAVQNSSSKSATPDGRPTQLEALFLVFCVVLSTVISGHQQGGSKHNSFGRSRFLHYLETETPERRKRGLEAA